MAIRFESRCAGSPVMLMTSARRCAFPRTETVCLRCSRCYVVGRRGRRPCASTRCVSLPRVCCRWCLSWRRVSALRNRLFHSLGFARDGRVQRISSLAVVVQGQQYLLKVLLWDVPRLFEIPTGLNPHPPFFTIRSHPAVDHAHHTVVRGLQSEVCCYQGETRQWRRTGNAMRCRRRLCRLGGRCLSR